MARGEWPDWSPQAASPASHSRYRLHPMHVSPKKPAGSFSPRPAHQPNHCDLHQRSALFIGYSSYPAKQEHKASSLLHLAIKLVKIITPPQPLEPASAAESFSTFHARTPNMQASLRDRAVVNPGVRYQELMVCECVAQSADLVSLWLGTSEQAAARVLFPSSCHSADSKAIEGFSMSAICWLDRLYVYCSCDIEPTLHVKTASSPGGFERMEDTSQKSDWPGSGVGYPVKSAGLYIPPDERKSLHPSLTPGSSQPLVCSQPVARLSPLSSL